MEFSSIAIGSDGLPIVSFFNSNHETLNVAVCADNLCTSISLRTLEGLNSNDVGAYTSIAIGSDGLPIISYFDLSNNDLKTAHCADNLCTSSSLETLDSLGFVGEYTSIAIGSDGLPVVSYFDSSNGDLKVAHCANARCS